MKLLQKYKIISVLLCALRVSVLNKNIYICIL